MKVIKTFFDEYKYKRELEKKATERQETCFGRMEFARNAASFYDEIAKTVDKTKYEKVVEFLYLNAVVDEGEPKLIVYNDEDGVTMIDRKNVKILQ